MNRPSYKPGLAQQRGVVVMIMLVIMVMGSAYFLITSLTKGDPQHPRMVDATTELNQIREALIGYAISNGRCLPCPSASATSGTAAASCTTASARVGFLPWLDLNLGEQDYWGHRYRYKVDPNFATGSACDFSIAADMIAKTRDALDTLTDIPLPSTLAAVIISHGPNGFGSFNINGVALSNPPAANIDERTNRLNGTLAFIQRPMVTVTAAASGPFDDVIGWVTRQELRDQLVKSNCCGPLPP
ncbi:MAG: hypothetical protein KKA36_04845 [Gammaproteobacteria bacterium]|nr:hypothetical protein [Gammaproteobacteria bacterium]MBU2478396.1 hypothetical protein [Gammaproteobacteria bacterium]